MISPLAEKNKATLVGCVCSNERVYNYVVPSKHIVAIKIEYVLTSTVGFSMTTSDIPEDKTVFFSLLATEYD